MRPFTSPTRILAGSTRSVFLAAFIAMVFSPLSAAATPVVNAPLPPLEVGNHGELQLQGDDIIYLPWQANAAPDKVHVIQYLAATMSASKIYAPFTDQLQQEFEPGAVQVTSIINLNAALWGTSGLVMSEIKKNKRKHPESIMVLDKKGYGASEWGLGKKGSALLIIDKQGDVRFFSKAALSDAELESAVALVKSLHSASSPTNP